MTTFERFESSIISNLGHLQNQSKYKVCKCLLMATSQSWAELNIHHTVFDYIIIGVM